MPCPRCGNNENGTVIYECKKCKTIYCITWGGGLFGGGRQGGCASADGCPKCDERVSTARELRKL